VVGLLLVVLELVIVVVELVVAVAPNVLLCVTTIVQDRRGWYNDNTPDLNFGSARL
jgi:hypothetical protein